MLVLDCGLVVVSLYLSFAAKFGFSISALALVAYLPLLPYLLICIVCLSLFFDFRHIQLASYDANSTIKTAVLAASLCFCSLALGWAGKIQIDVLFHIISGVFFFVFSVISRALLLQVVQAVYRYSEKNTACLDLWRWRNW